MLKHWYEKVYDPAVRKDAERRESFTTSSGIKLAPVYAAPRDSDLPGVHPYTRGIHPTMYRTKHWTMRQYAGFGDAEASNRRYRYLLDHGQTGLSVAFDLPTQMGLDSDSSRAQGEVGRVGVAIDTLADMRRLFDSIPLDGVSTSMTINATASTLLAMYVVVAEEQGVSPSKLRGTVQNDILKEYMARGTFIYPPKPSMRLVTDLFAFGNQALPQWNTISVSGYHIREAGSTAVQEIAFTLADGLAYLSAAVAAGLPVDAVAPRLTFFFNVHNQFLEEVAKFRAARRLWAQLVTARFSPKDPRSSMLRFHTQTAGSTLTAQQVENNIVRIAIQALASVLGGTQSLHTNSMDEALALPSEKAALTALRTQQIIAHETGVADVVDPLGGAHVIESLTDELASQARALIDRIDAAGGMVAALSEGLPQRMIAEAAYESQLRVERKESIVVGVNAYTEESAGSVPRLQIDAGLEQRQIDRLRALRAGRSTVAVQNALAAIDQAARGTDNLLPRIIEAVRAQCSVGEISDALRRVFGEHHEIV
jgi:methylmalonyl-CoA mutase N-terminal domain/subunit